MDEKQLFCTNSILNWLKSNLDVVEEYFEKCYDRGTRPNYTDMLRMVSGTTIDDVNLASTLVVRAECTKWLVGEYSGWYERNL